MAPFHWTCPFCNRDTTIQDSNIKTDTSYLTISNADGPRLLNTQWIVCPNAECRKVELRLFMSKLSKIGGAWGQADFIRSWTLIPPSNAKVFPAYVPRAIVDDYSEACL